MIDLGLSSAGQRALVRTLATSGHLVGARVSILDRNHKPFGDLDGKVTGGQVNIDTTADVSRQLQLVFIDEKKRSGVDTNDGRPELRRMIQVHYLVFVEEVIGDWVEIPIFTGPITSVSRDGEVVTLEALGKESLCLTPAWISKTFPKGYNRVSLIRLLLRTVAGETRMALPKGWKARTIRPFAVKKDSLLWDRIQVIVKGSRAQLFYDGRGTAKMRKRPVRTVFTFKDGDGGMLLSVPKVQESSDAAINTVQVIGAIPVGKKSPLTFTTSLPRNHPYSPQSLIRGGRPDFLPEVIEDDTLRTQKEVEQAARRRLQEIQMDESDVSFECLPMPLLEEGDPFVVDAKDAKITTRLSKMVIPIGHEGTASVGFLAPAHKRRR